MSSGSPSLTTSSDTLRPGPRFGFRFRNSLPAVIWWPFSRAANTTCTCTTTTTTTNIYSARNPTATTATATATSTLKTNTNTAIQPKRQQRMSLYRTLAAFNVETLFVRKRAPGPGRVVYVGGEGLPSNWYETPREGAFWSRRRKPEEKVSDGPLEPPNGRRVKKTHVYTTNQVLTSKYTVLTFLPRNLLEQFRRIANIFFAAIAILQFFPKFSTISPGLVIFPLLVVLLITAAKDGYEDFKRHQSDRRVNRSEVRVLEAITNHNCTAPKARNVVGFFGGLWRRTRKDKVGDVEKSAEEWRTTAWEDVCVGDVVKIIDGESVPADVLICASSEEEGVAFVETKNLDGETNLKSRRAVWEGDWTGKRFWIECDRPEENMFRMNAAVHVHDGGEVIPVDISMTLLRGTVLRNTKWVVGVVLFTGEDSKIVLNSGGTPSKRSRVERQMNPQVFINLLILAAMAVVCGIVDSVLEHRDYPRGAPWLFMDNQSDDNPSINGLITWAFALITFQNIVPISLYISIEFVRTMQALFIWFDGEMVYKKEGGVEMPTLARSWNLSDDLGQIEYVFSDKTGTLTQNAMIFRQCSIDGVVYGSSTPTSEPLIPAEKLDPPSRTMHAFFSVLALCHTVLTSPAPDDGIPQYKAQSPDEAALVGAAAAVGYVFRGRERDLLTISTPQSDVDERYVLLGILEFTSARKRMSVIVRQEESGKILLLTKGADSVVFERLRDGEATETTERDLAAFANGGLRTLTLAYRVVPEAEYAEWAEAYRVASVALEGREALVEQVSGRLERDLRLVGATAIEDSLQVGVPETISDLKRAGVKVWVATGDKMETAIAIGYSTNLIGGESRVVIVRGGERGVEAQMKGAMKEVQARCVLVIDGAALAEAFASAEHTALLLELATQCEGVICCRVSPLQKALVVKMVKDGLGVMTLAIGDGANDVSMIQAADVGVGISGEEGLQAVNASDYAIGQFRFLKKLLLVHGHWSYARNGNMILNFFYKNIVCIGVLWWFQIYCAWSSSFVFEYTYLLFWNSFWTIAPVIAIGLFDRLIDSDTLMRYPELYRYGREGRWFGLGWFGVYMLDGVYQSAIVFFLTLYTYFTPSARADGYDVSQIEFSTTMVFSAVFVVNAYNGLNTRVWTGWVFFALGLGLVLLWVYSAVYNAISPGWIVTKVYGNNHYLFASPLFWLAFPIGIALSLTPMYVGKAWKMGFAGGDDVDVLRMGGKSDEILRNTTPPPTLTRVRTDMSTGVRSTHNGYNFDMEEGGVEVGRMVSRLSSRSGVHLPMEEGRGMFSLRRKRRR